MIVANDIILVKKNLEVNKLALGGKWLEIKQSIQSMTLEEYTKKLRGWYQWQ
jgi:hypothetical protein